jgi:hypothetical protein
MGRSNVYFFRTLSEVSLIHFDAHFYNFDDSFGAPDSAHPYIDMYQPPYRLPVFLDILRNEKPFFIRGYQEDDAGPVRTTFGTSVEEPVGEGE